MLRKKNFPKDKALDHFDEFYGNVFGNEWPSIRHALLLKHKYAAVVNNYSDSEKVIGRLESLGALNIRTLFNLQKQYNAEDSNKRKRRRQMKKVQALDKELEEREQEYISSVDNADNNLASDASLEKQLSEAEVDNTRLVDPKNFSSSELLHQYVPATKLKGREDWIPESEHFRYYQVTNDFSVKIEKSDLHFPEHLNVYCYEPENFTKFSSPPMGSTGVFDYYLMDGGSLLPVLALDLKPGCRMLDMCAAPGGKSLLAIQTLYPECVVSNDIAFSRVNRIYGVYKEYLYDLNSRWLQTGRLKITHNDGCTIAENDFDRILVDVPCTTDRHSVQENDNNLFKSSRIKERLKLPELQSELLTQALKIVKVGGIVVYSTCSLSPIQNDGVVNMALRKLWQDSKVEVVVQ